MAKEPAKLNHLGQEIIEYPKWLHISTGSVIVKNKEEEEKLLKNETKPDLKKKW